MKIYRNGRFPRSRHHNGSLKALYNIHSNYNTKVPLRHTTTFLQATMHRFPQGTLQRFPSYNTKNPSRHSTTFLQAIIEKFPPGTIHRFPPGTLQRSLKLQYKGSFKVHYIGSLKAHYNVPSSYNRTHTTNSRPIYLHVNFFMFDIP